MTDFGSVKSENGDRGDGQEGQDGKPTVREIEGTPKPPVCLSKKRKGAEHLQTKMIEIMGKDNDEIDLVFQAFAKRIKKFKWWGIGRFNGGTQCICDQTCKNVQGKKGGNVQASSNNSIPQDEIA